MSLSAKNRWQAFGIHLSISLLIFAALAAVIYFWWYPGFLFRYDGGLEGMKLIAGVDFFIGPVLTLVVYKVGKKSLRFDLACIALIQLFCIAGGMWAVWKTRPVAVVYAAGSFATTNTPGYSMQKIDIEKVAPLQAKWPVWLAVDLPEGQEDSLRDSWAMAGAGIEYNVENYVPYEKMLSRISAKGLRAETIGGMNTTAMVAFGKTHPDARFFPIKTSTTIDAYVAVDVRSGTVLAFFN